MNRPTASADVLGVRVDLVSLDQAADIILGWAADRAARPSGAPGQAGRPGRARLVVTPNPEIIVTADAELRGVLNQADLAVPDGIGVVWALRRQGIAVPGRVTGCDLFVEVLRRGAGSGLKVFLLGSRPGVAETAADRCRDQFPGLVITGTHHGYFGPRDDQAMADRVAASGAQLVAVGMGSPRQELWAWRQAARLGGGVVMPLGGTLDVLAETVRRPPAWLARCNLEWLGRIAGEPARWRRAPRLARYAWRVVRSGGRRR